jgi:hypothetical protein
MLGIPRRIGLSDKSAEGCADDHRPLDAKVVAQCFQVVGPLGQRPGRRRSGVAPTVPALVVVDQLRYVGQSAEVRLVHGMVVPRSAVDEDDSRLLPHSRTVGDQLCSFDVEEDPAVIHAHIHSASRSAAGFVALRHLREPQSNHIRSIKRPLPSGIFLAVIFASSATDPGKR